VKGITKRKMRRNTSRSAGIFGIGYDRTPHTVERVWKVAVEIKYTNYTTKQSHAQACLVAEPRLTAFLQDVGAGKARKSSSRHKEKKIRDSHDSRISGKKYVCKRNIGMNIKSAQIASPVLGNTHGRKGRANAARWAHEVVRRTNTSLLSIGRPCRVLRI